MGPFQLSPLPKAAPRPQSKRAGKVEIISSSPYKHKLAEESAQKGSKKAKRDKAPKDKSTAYRPTKKTPSNQGNLKARPPGKSKVSKNTRTVPNLKKSCKDQNNDELCVYCDEYYAESGWTQCQMCCKWAHDVCAGVSPTQRNFVCDFCDDSGFRQLISTFELCV